MIKPTKQYEKDQHNDKTLFWFSRFDNLSHRLSQRSSFKTWLTKILELINKLCFLYNMNNCFVTKSNSSPNTYNVSFIPERNVLLYLHMT